MSKGSTIEWTDHTFNPWWGCVKISEGCTNCYAETWAKRYGHSVWGPKSGRRFFSDNHWAQPIRWNKKAEALGVRQRVFCASMADVFEDNPVLANERERLWRLIEHTEYLDWQLLTKRPENMLSFAPWSGDWPSNIWAMTSVETQAAADRRIPALLHVPARVRGLSVEPLLGPVDLSPWIKEGIQWVIVGGESGPKSRPMNPDWVRNIRDLCVEAGTPFFFKQWGNWVPVTQSEALDEGMGPTRATQEWSGRHTMTRVSKKVAGRLLEGRTWEQLPAPGMGAGISLAA